MALRFSSADAVLTYAGPTGETKFRKDAAARAGLLSTRLPGVIVAEICMRGRERLAAE
jgi:hypothetical protein